jgi:hypothetical protein
MIKNPPSKLIQYEVNWQMYHYGANQKLARSDNPRVWVPTIRFQQLHDQNVSLADIEGL